LRKEEPCNWPKALFPKLLWLHPTSRDDTATVKKALLVPCYNSTVLSQLREMYIHILNFKTFE